MVFPFSKHNPANNVPRLSYPGYRIYSSHFPNNNGIVFPACKLRIPGHGPMHPIFSFFPFHQTKRHRYVPRNGQIRHRHKSLHYHFEDYPLNLHKQYIVPQNSGDNHFYFADAIRFLLPACSDWTNYDTSPRSCSDNCLYPM